MRVDFNREAFQLRLRVRYSDSLLDMSQRSLLTVSEEANQLTPLRVKDLVILIGRNDIECLVCKIHNQIKNPRSNLNIKLPLFQLILSGNLCVLQPSRLIHPFPLLLKTIRLLLFNSLINLVLGFPFVLQSFSLLLPHFEVMVFTLLLSLLDVRFLLFLRSLL